MEGQISNIHIQSSEYANRLEELGLSSLEERRHMADMVMVHKILQGRGGLDHRAWFEKAETAVRTTRRTADALNLRVKHGRLEMRTNFFSV